MAFSIRPATRSDSKALIGLYGQSGCGKTMSALLLGRGLIGPTGKLVLIDTESGRGSLYADVIPGGYETIALDEPFSPARYIEAIEAAEKAGAGCIIIDSMSHEWESVGGIADMAAEIERRTGKSGLHCWKEPKVAHQKMLLYLLRAKTHVICCLRAKRKSRQAKDERTGKTVIVKDDFYTPKQDGDFIYELTVHAEILADHKLRVTKVSHPALASIFKDGVVISEDTGRAVAEWARGGQARPNPYIAPNQQPAPSPDDDMPTAPQIDKTTARVNELIAEMDKPGADVDAILADETVRKQVAWMLDKRPAEHKRLFDHANAKRRAQRSNGDMPDMGHAEAQAAAVARRADQRAE